MKSGDYGPYVGMAVIEAVDIGPGIVRTMPAGQGFFSMLPSDPAALAGMAKRGGGIVIIFTLDHARNCLKAKYGPFGRARPLRRLEDWREAPAAFIKKYSQKLSSAMQLFETEYCLYKDKAEKKYSGKCLPLPKPPPGYYWKPDDCDLDMADPPPEEETRTVRLWNDAFGPMPGPTPNC